VILAIEPDWRFGPEAWNDPPVPSVDRIQRFLGLLVGLFSFVFWSVAMLALWGLFTDPDPKSAAKVLGASGSIALLLTSLAWSLWCGRGVPLWVMRMFAILAFPALILVAMQARGIQDVWMLVGPGLILLHALPALWRGPARVSPPGSTGRIDS
jgi:hypothetical protein